jgi:hypothetical protein
VSAVENDVRVVATSQTSNTHQNDVNSAVNQVEPIPKIKVLSHIKFLWMLNK